VSSGLLLRRRFLLPSARFVSFETASATLGEPLLVCFGILAFVLISAGGSDSSLRRRNFLGHK